MEWVGVRSRESEMTSMDEMEQGMGPPVKELSKGNSWGRAWLRGLEPQPQMCQNIFPLQMRIQGSVFFTAQHLTEI